MRIIVAGGGNVGAFIVAQLASADHDIVVIEQDRARLQQVAASGDADVAQWVDAAR